MPQIGQDVYDELIEFLENQQDADCRGDPPQYVPNKAMSLLTRLGTTRESAGEGSEVRRPNEGSSHLESPSPKTPYGLALDLASSIVERDDKANASEPRSLRPGLTDEYTLAKALLDIQPYITSLKNDVWGMNPRNTAIDEILLARARDLLYQAQGSLGWIGAMNSELLRQQIKTFLEDTKEPPQVLGECEECGRIVVSPLRRFERDTK